MNNAMQFIAKLFRFKGYLKVVDFKIQKLQQDPRDTGQAVQERVPLQQMRSALQNHWLS